jgi:adenosylcobinamide-phosphate synthase
VPARLTAFGFAVVGNFEEAVGGWRRDAGAVAAPQRRHHHRRCGRCAGGAARRCNAAPGRVTPDRSKTFDVGCRPTRRPSPGLHPRRAAGPGHLQSVVGLVWRSVVLWMLLVALLSLANLLG